MSLMHVIEPAPSEKKFGASLKRCLSMGYYGEGCGRYKYR
jgi:hypothetical protein